MPNHDYAISPPSRYPYDYIHFPPRRVRRWRPLVTFTWLGLFVVAWVGCLFLAGSLLLGTRVLMRWFVL